MTKANPVNFFRKSLENAEMYLEDTEEQTAGHGSQRGKSGCKALHVTHRWAFSMAGWRNKNTSNE